MRILFTGGTGLLALNWALSIRDRHTVILGLHEREIVLSGVKSVKINLEIISHLVNSIESEKPDVVIHTAGLTSVEKCEANPELAHYANVELAENVASACASIGVPLVHISTDHLFSGEIPLVDETHPVTPVNQYGRTKAEAESRVLDIFPEALVIRTNFYAWGPVYRRSFSDVIIDALRERKEINLFQDVFYTPIIVSALVDTVHELVNQSSTGIYHVVGDERISKYEFGLQLAKEFNLDRTLIRPGLFSDVPNLVQRPHDMSLSNKKTCELLRHNLGGVSEHLTMLRQHERKILEMGIKTL